MRWHPLFDLVLLILVVASCLMWGIVAYEKIYNERATSVTEEIADNVENKTSAEIADILQQYDRRCIGWVVWDSGIVREPIVRGGKNSDWIRTSITGGYDPYGTVFIDAKGDPSDENITLYGHSAVGNRQSTLRFSQLQWLHEQDAFDANRDLTIIWNGRSHRYRTAAVCVVDTTVDPWAYEQNVFQDHIEKERWITNVKKRNLVESDIVLRKEDRFATFQTCLDDDSGRRVIVIAVEAVG